MFVNVVMVGLGIIGLVVGGQWLVKGAARLAGSFGASPLVIGLTIVAWATSAPELIVNVSAAAQGSTEMALGNVIGSNIVNIGLQVQFPVLLGFSLLILFLGFRHPIGRLQAVFLLTCYFVFVGMTIGGNV